MVVLMFVPMEMMGRRLLVAICDAHNQTRVGILPGETVQSPGRITKPIAGG